MDKFLLSIDPSIDNTGFTLWKNYKPILILSYSFKKYNYNDFLIKILYMIDSTIELENGYIHFKRDLKIIIEKGFLNPKVGRGKSELDYLRGFIVSQINKELINKEMLIFPSSWKSYYIRNWNNNDNQLTIKNFKSKSVFLGKTLISNNNWNINVKNHDEADSLLIGWYFLNKEKE